MLTFVSSRLEVQPTLEAFASKDTALIPPYMSWERDSQAVGRDALMEAWDPVSLCFPPFH
jgi:hypothetical protein